MSEINKIKDPSTPLIEIAVIITKAEGKPFFYDLLKEFQIPGKVTILVLVAPYSSLLVG